MDTISHGEGLSEIFEVLLSEFGPQGWWPVSQQAGDTGFDSRGYHPKLYDVPDSTQGRLEVCVGAILAQSTSWVNSEKALGNLIAKDIMLIEALNRTPQSKLAGLIHSALYNNQKARKIKFFVSFIVNEYGGELDALLAEPIKKLRPNLIGIWGIGPETADSIVLYAGGKPSFVVDAYTRRIFERIGHLKGGESYDEVKDYFEGNLPDDAKLYNEFHALIVEHAKRHCRIRRECGCCPLQKVCETFKV